jgi:hypothetical protein
MLFTLTHNVYILELLLSKMVIWLHESLERFKKRFPYSLVEFVQLAGVGFYDLLLHIKVKLFRENPIGVYVGICRNFEKDWFFESDGVGGYCGLAIIRLFATDTGMLLGTEEGITDVLNHEVLHQVIGKVAGSKARHELDNVHKSYWLIEGKTGRYSLVFVYTKDGRTQLIS